MIKKNRTRPFLNHITKWTIKNNFNLYENNYAIISQGFTFLRKNQIESCRKVISKILKSFSKNAKYIISVNFKTPITKKSLGARMGRGKGSVAEYIYKLKKNNILFSFKNINLTILKILINKIKYKLPVKLKIISFYKNGYCRNKDKLFR